MSLSREFAAFVAKLTYEGLPPEVVDRAKGVTLQALSSALVAHDMPASRQALTLMKEEEVGGGGAATVLCRGEKLTKAGAAFVNAETIFAGGKWDTFRMLTHPGIAILPAELTAAEISGRSVTGFSCRTGVRDLRRGGRRRQIAAPRRKPDPQRDRAMRQPGGRQSRRCA